MQQYQPRPQAQHQQRQLQDVVARLGVSQVSREAKSVQEGEPRHGRRPERYRLDSPAVGGLACVVWIVESSHDENAAIQSGCNSRGEPKDSARMATGIRVVAIHVASQVSRVTAETRSSRYPHLILIQSCRKISQILQGRRDDEFYSTHFPAAFCRSTSSRDFFATSHVFHDLVRFHSQCFKGRTDRRDRASATARSKNDYHCL